MDFAYCLSIEFVIEMQTDIWNKQNSCGECDFPEMNFQGGILQGRICQLFLTKFFLFVLLFLCLISFTCGDVPGKFSGGILNGDGIAWGIYFVGGGTLQEWIIHRRNSPWGKIRGINTQWVNFTAGEILHGGISHGRDIS